MRPKYLLLLLAAGACVSGILSAADASLPRMEVRADRSEYQAGETAMVSLETHAGGPSDVYLIMTTPSGKQLYADRTLQFRPRRVAVATNFIVAEGKVEMPVSFATSDLVRPGEYKIEAYVTPPGAGLSGGDSVGETRFIVTIPGLNYLAIHDYTSPRYDDDCGVCHVDKTREVHLAPGIPSFHTLKHRMFSAGGMNSCAVCHKGADLVDKSAAAIRKDVAPEFCAQCHGAFSTGKRLFAK